VRGVGWTVVPPLWHGQGNPALPTYVIRISASDQ